MKDGREVAVVAHGSMSGISPVAAYSTAQQTTPSPFTFSVASTRWSSRPPYHVSNVFLRLLALIFSFVSALFLAAPPPKENRSDVPSSFEDYPELLYCLIVTTLAFIYSALQLFKGVCDIAYRGSIISDMTSDYVSFILDQLAGYLLFSSSSVTVSGIRQIEQTSSLWKSAIVAVSMSFAAFIMIATSALLSGYKLCKRIIW